MPDFPPSRLSQLLIDVDKDWLTKRLRNIGAPTTVGDALRKGTRLTASEMLDGAFPQVLTGQGLGVNPAYSSIVVSEGRCATLTTTYLSIPGISVDYTSTGTLTLTANRLYHEPFFAVTPITLDQIIIEVTTLASGKSVRLGIYSADGDWQPVSLIVDAGTINAGSTGVKTLSINKTVWGKYLGVLVSDGTPTIRVIVTTTRYTGYLTTLGAAPYIGQLYRAFTYAPLPDPPSDWDTVIAGTGFMHAIFYRVSVP